MWIDISQYEAEDCSKALSEYFYGGRLDSNHCNEVLSELQADMIEGFTSNMSINNCIKFREYIEHEV